MRARRAIRKYREFHGRSPKTAVRVALPSSAFRVGKILGVTYEIIEDGKNTVYHHDFDTPPPLAVSADGRTALILRGEWAFTKRGFEG